MRAERREQSLNLAGMIAFQIAEPQPAEATSHSVYPLDGVSALDALLKQRRHPEPQQNPSQVA